jgi:hypothetical protein
VNDERLLNQNIASHTPNAYEPNTKIWGQEQFEGSAKFLGNIPSILPSLQKRVSEFVNGRSE